MLTPLTILLRWECVVCNAGMIVNELGFNAMDWSDTKWLCIKQLLDSSVAQKAHNQRLQGFGG